MSLINCTPHVVVVIDGDHSITVAPSGILPRVAMTSTQVGDVTVDGHVVPILETSYGEIQDLPAPTADTVYVVSALVVAAAKAAGFNRGDLVSPTGQQRNAAGQVIGCTGFSR